MVTVGAISRSADAPALRPTAKIAVFLLGLCALLNIYSTQPLLAELAAVFQVPVDRATWTITATTLGVAVAAPFAGSISDYLGRKRVMLAAIATTAAATVACTVAWSFGALLAFRFAQGMLIPFVFAVAVAYIAEEHAGAAAVAANALYVSGTAFGGFCSRFLSGAMATHYGWRSSFGALAVVLLVVLATTAAWLDPDRRFRRSGSLLASARGIGAHVGNGRLIGTCFVGAAILFLQVGSFTYAGLYLQAPPFGLTTFQIGAVFAVFLVAVVVTPAAGALITRVGRPCTYGLASAVSLAGLGLTLIPTTPTVVAGLAASATGVFCGQSCATGYAAAAGGAGRSSAVGLYLTSYYLGGSVGAVAPASLYRWAGWPACAGLLAAVIVISMVVAVVAWRPDGMHR
ncbi:MFS transporter [Mycobacterium haemophilum]|uniref:Transporter n=1 Tax=Mycobacterium haemophilum TaxID=29311 RepID=A0A0I9XTH8_9MYCO|nr:MFS transporter [Mycobacterium haemophilum]KLO30292.1 transporter [Mycobacterium haemophilum]KLO37367.1 transporter [Mycobacterium haemophilum]KLO43916.1 transporter [Mycobacterium haemophilum]KLO49665.1 transporter [Mycobacterium haemophilum]